MRERANARTASSIRKLAAACGRSIGTVHNWIHDPRWNFGKRGPWEIERVKAWAAETLERGPAVESEQPALKDLPPERKAKLAKLLEQRRGLKLANDVKEGLYHRVDECERRSLLKIHDVKSKLLTVADAMPADTPAATRQWVKDRMDQTCREFAEGKVTA